MCAAVAFGVGLGFKDGVGKATEFFAGYAEICIVKLKTVDRKLNSIYSPKH